MNRAVFLDRDGVINELVRRDDGRYTSPWKIEELVYKPGVQDAMVDLRNLNYKVFIITNQPGVYYGDMSVYDMVDICRNVQEWTGADEVYPCLFPITSSEKADYKPGCGAILKLLKKYDINPASSFMIGDRWKDIVAGYRAKLTTIYVNEEPYIYPFRLRHIQPNFKKKNLMEATALICSLTYR